MNYFGAEPSKYQNQDRAHRQACVESTEVLSDHDTRSDSLDATPEILLIKL